MASSLTGPRVRPAQVRTQFRQTLLQMGFTTTLTSSRAFSGTLTLPLFQTQQHRAYGQHDAFFLGNPVEVLQRPANSAKPVEWSRSGWLWLAGKPAGGEAG